MTTIAKPTAAIRLNIPGWLPAALLVLIMALMGPNLGSGARPIFIAGCLAVGLYSWSKSPGAHLQAAIILFSFAPFVRRIVDLSLGFDPGGLMIAGPLLALLAPLPELRSLVFDRNESDEKLAPFLLFGACVAYAAFLTVAQGDLSQAASGTLKWGAPLVYGVALYRRKPDVFSLIRDAAAAFSVILPITGLYGLYQYIDPPDWDRYWLKYAQITSAGLPLPYEVRTFSTMNGPAAFATFTAVGLLLVYILRSGWLLRFAMLPAILALALSLYRTAWISLGVGVVFCLLFSKTRIRAGGALLILAAAVVAALLFTPFGTVIGDRLTSFGDASNDDSGQERLAQFNTMWNLPDSGLFGIGFNTVDTGTAGAAAIDGMIAACWSSMGIVVGLVCLVSLIYVIGEAIGCTLRGWEPERAVLGALVCGWLVQLPLASIASGELGFLFWMTVTLAKSLPPGSVPR